MTFLVICAVLRMLFQTSPDQGRGRITEQEIAKTVLKQTDCDNPELKIDPAQRVSINHLEYFDFTGDGNDEAIVVASTCMTGTAGPDVHAVFTRGPEGEIVELAVPEVDKSNYAVLFGNRNYQLTVKDGLLVATFTDTSDRNEPLVIRYRWNGRQFVVDSIQKSSPYKTSYNCDLARKEMEQAICYVKSLAELDLQLATVYHARLNSLPPDQKKSLQNDQRRWLAERDSKCMIYKWWVDCLSELYTKRIAELRQPSK